MSVTLPHQSEPEGQIAPPVEALQAALGRVLLDRERLRLAGLAADLEVNRREICRLQWELSRALILRYTAV